MTLYSDLFAGEIFSLYNSISTWTPSSYESFKVSSFVSPLLENICVKNASSNGRLLSCQLAKNELTEDLPTEDESCHMYVHEMGTLPS
jgi:hypothetical protein